MYVTWDQLLLVGGFILSLIKLLRDIYNKKITALTFHGRRLFLNHIGEVTVMRCSLVFL